jgi:hypothetical protein
MDRFRIMRLWLLVDCLAMIGLGILMVFFPHSAVLAPVGEPVNEAFWPGQALPLPVVRYQRWAYGTWGATVAGMSIFGLGLVLRGFSDGKKWARETLAAGVLVWFTLDTWVSLASGVDANAIFNTLILVAFGIPLVLTWRDFGELRRQEKGS